MYEYTIRMNVLLKKSCFDTKFFKNKKAIDKCNKTNIWKREN